MKIKINKNSLFALVAITLIMSSGLFFIGSQFAPKFTFYLFLISTLVVAYASTEKLIFHDAAEFENRFWTMLSFLFSYVIILVEDSPFRLPSHMGWFIIFGFSFLAHNYNRALHRRSLTKPSPFADKVSESKKKANLPPVFIPLADCMSIIDHPWISSNIFLPGVLYAEQKIISIFDECSSDSLNNALPLIELSLILYKVKDHRFARLNNRSKLLKLLCETRVRELRVQSKAILLDAMMRMKISANKGSEAYVRNIICCTYRNDLTELKCIMDSKLDINSMHKLIFEDVRDPAIRQQIILHIKKQANEQLAHSKIGSKEGKEFLQRAMRKILSDVDDTLMSSGGHFPAGVDSAYPHKALYPGVLEFYRELDLGTQGEDNWDILRKGNLVFLSARPHVYKDLSESRTFLKFQQIEGMNSKFRPTLLSGSLTAGTKYMYFNDAKALATTKYQSYKEYMSLYPEYHSVFVGDNGQGDAMAAEMIYDDKELVSSSNDCALTRSYMHIVTPINQTPCRNDAFKRPHLNKKVCFFYTYIDAAVDAYQHNLIRLTGLRRIMDESVQGFLKINTWDKIATATESGECKREVQIRILNASLAIGNTILLRDGPLAPVKLIRFRSQFKIGQPVKTSYGYGVVEAFRAVDGIYTISFPWDRTGRQPPTRGYFPALSLTKLPEKLANSVTPLATIDVYEPRTGSLLSFGKYKRSSSPVKSSVKETAKLSKSGPEVRTDSITTVSSVHEEEIIYLDDVTMTEGKTTGTPYSVELFRITGRKYSVSLLVLQSELPPRSASGSFSAPATSSTPSREKDSNLKQLIQQSPISDKKSKSSTAAAEAMKKLPSFKHVIGAVAWTPYGRGLIMEHRVKDDIVIVRYLDWTGFGFLKRDNVVVLTDPKVTVFRKEQARLELLAQASLDLQNRPKYPTDSIIPTKM